MRGRILRERKVRRHTQHWHIMRPRGLRWCQIYYREFLNQMEGEFGDKFRRFLEHQALDEGLVVVRGVSPMRHRNCTVLHSRLFARVWPAHAITCLESLRMQFASEDIRGGVSGFEPRTSYVTDVSGQGPYRRAFCPQPFWHKMPVLLFSPALCEYIAIHIAM